MTELEHLRTALRRYYGEHLQGSADLATNACCAAGAPPAWLREPLARIEPSVSDRFYGCGFPIPVALRGARVLDLGCGTGRDVFLLAQLVGEEGFVHGVDMTEAQLAVGRATIEVHARRFGHARPNVALHEGYIEDLRPLPIDDGSLDVVVSNCVVNLSPRKDLVLAEAARVLKEGGELYLSDVFADRRLPPEVANDPTLHAECLGGALYLPDFLDLARAAGFADPRTVSRAPISVSNPELEARVGAARFESVTLRLLRIPALEARCEDYGQLATYRGGLTEAPAVLWLDDHHAFEVGRPERVCRNTALMLSASRFAPWFDVSPPGPHFGAFPCDPTMAARVHAPTAAAGTGGCC